MTKFIDTNIECIPSLVKWCDNFRVCEVVGDTPWHAYLIDAEVWVWCDDSSGREIHALPHQITANTTLFTLQPLLYGL